MLAELVTLDHLRGLANELAYDLSLGDRRRSDMGLVEASPDGVEGVDVDPLGEARFAAQQPFQLRAQRIGERVGESRQQHAGVGMCARQMSGAVQRDDGLTGPGRAGDARWPGVVAFHHLPLLWVQEDGPFLPGKSRARCSSSIFAMTRKRRSASGCSKGVAAGVAGREHARLAAGRQFEQCFGGFGGQVVRQRRAACPRLRS